MKSPNSKQIINYEYPLTTYTPAAATSVRVGPKPPSEEAKQLLDTISRTRHSGSYTMFQSVASQIVRVEAELVSDLAKERQADPIVKKAAARGKSPARFFVDPKYDDIRSLDITHVKDFPEGFVLPRQLTRLSISKEQLNKPEQFGRISRSLAELPFAKKHMDTPEAVMTVDGDPVTVFTKLEKGTADNNEIEQITKVQDPALSGTTRNIALALTRNTTNKAVAPITIENKNKLLAYIKENDKQTWEKLRTYEAVLTGTNFEADIKAGAKEANTEAQAVQVEIGRVAQDLKSIYSDTDGKLLPTIRGTKFVELNAKAIVAETFKMLKQLNSDNRKIHDEGIRDNSQLKLLRLKKSSSGNGLRVSKTHAREKLREVAEELLSHLDFPPGDTEFAAEKDVEFKQAVVDSLARLEDNAISRQEKLAGQGKLDA